MIRGQNKITVDDIPMIIRIVLFTAPVDRVKIFDLLLKQNGNLSTSEIMEFLNLSRPTALRTMTELKVLGFVSMENESGDYDNSPKSIKLKEEYKWFLSEEFKRLREGFIPEKFDEKEERKKNTPTPTLKKYDDLDIEINFDNLRSIVLREFEKLEKDAKYVKGQRLIGHTQLKNALFRNSSIISMNIDDEAVDGVIKRIVKGGPLVELSKGRYYRPSTDKDENTATPAS